LTLIKYALEDFSAVEVAFFQAAIGAMGLLAIVLVEGDERGSPSATSYAGPCRRFCLGRSRSPRRFY
jgi:hypothetical protein